MIMVKVLVQFVYWYLIDVPKKILKGWRNFLKFNLEFFSIPLLFKTLFSYWRQYKWHYGQAFGISSYLETFVSNMISRVLGMIIRSGLIVAGLLVEIFIFLAGMVVFVGWFCLPVLLWLGLGSGLNALL